MGVPGLFSHLKKYNKRNDPASTIKSTLPRASSEPIHLYLDFNGGIYQVIRPELKTYESLIIHVLAYLDSIVLMMKQRQPATRIIENEFTGMIEEVFDTDDAGNIIFEDGDGKQMIEKLYIAIDGTPPRAKMEQQRSRRFHSICRNNHMAKLDEDYGSPEDNSGTNYHIDKNGITPGTVFMHKLRLAINKHIKTSPIMAEIKEIIFNDWSNPGEGEHKILDYIRNNPPSEGVIDENGERLMPKTIIYGLDGDLIMLAMSSQLNNVFLVREAYEYKQYAFEHKGYPYLFMDIDCLKSALLNEVSGKISSPLVGSSEKNRFIDDYILTCMILGNDFMPKIPWLNLSNNGPKIIQSAYLEVLNGQPHDSDRFLYNRETGQINMHMLSDMMAILMRRENNLIIKCIENRKHWKPKVNDEMTERERRVYMLEHLPMQYLGIEAEIEPTKPGWRGRFYNICHGFRSTPANIGAVCDAYLRTLIWNMYYYTRDGCPSWSWYYPYDYCPTLADFYYHIQDMTSHRHIKFSLGKPIHPQTLLLMVLPEKSSGLMAVDVQKHILGNPILSRVYFPRQYSLNLALHSKYYECTPKGIAKIDMDKADGLVRSCKMTKAEKERNVETGIVRIVNNI